MAYIRIFLETLLKRLMVVPRLAFMFQAATPQANEQTKIEIRLNLVYMIREKPTLQGPWANTIYCLESEGRILNHSSTIASTVTMNNVEVTGNLELGVTSSSGTVQPRALVISKHEAQSTSRLADCSKIFEISLKLESNQANL